MPPAPVGWSVFQVFDALLVSCRDVFEAFDGVQDDFEVAGYLFEAFLIAVLHGVQEFDGLG
jgi:hypothetical protein